MTRSGNPDLRYGGINQCGVQKEYQNIKLSLGCLSLTAVRLVIVFCRGVSIQMLLAFYATTTRNLGTTSSSVAASLPQYGRLSRLNSSYLYLFSLGMILLTPSPPSQAQPNTSSWLVLLGKQSSMRLGGNEIIVFIAVHSDHQIFSSL